MSDRDSENLEKIRLLLERHLEPNSGYSGGGGSDMDPITWSKLVLVIWVIAIGGIYVLAPHARESNLFENLYTVCIAVALIGGLPAVVALLTLLLEPRE